jgi:hypothetical protein
MELHHHTVKLGTISRWVREGRLTEREGLLLCGQRAVSAATSMSLFASLKIAALV